GGFTCPNIDGKCGVGGCIYCSSRGSGDFAESPLLSVSEQYRLTREKLSSKWSVERCIPYFQAHTNTYAPCAVLKEKFEEALALDGVVGMNVATGADCLEDDTVEYLAEIAERTVLTVELGLQSVHDETAKLINRGHSYADFVEGYEKLRKASAKINICVHLIFGLPGETEKMMLESVEKVAKLRPDQVKLHLLHVLKSSALGQIYLDGGYIPMEREAYISTVVDALEILPPETVVARITGDGMAEDLLAPDWSRRKVAVINDVDKLLYQRNTFQGRLWNC
ncbi:MAG: TIGR01212 family radical SAM protein, partial [Clostridia bacterium]|nr:TIGR01212 family radical SAM protein [Clostridia bacterium]